MNKSTLIIISSFKFAQYDYERFEVNEYKKYLNVKILDISWFIDSALSGGTVGKKYAGNDIISIRTGYELFKLLLQYRRENDRLVILSLVQPFNIRTLLYFLGLRFIKLPYIDLYNSGCPVIPEKNKIISRLIKYKTQPRFLFASFRGLISSYLFKTLKLYPTYRLVAGDVNYHVYGKSLERKGVTVLNGGSNDYIMYLNQCNYENSHINNQSKIGVLLDGVAPMFGSDAITLRKKEPFTAKEWYSSMTQFLDSIEKETGVIIKVAAHPKSNHAANPPYLGYRDVVYGETINLISNSKYIIARNSASIAWGILLKKPIIFVYSNQLAKDDKFMKSINYISNLVGANPVNIDDSVNHSNVLRFLTCNTALYEKYIRNYLTSRIDGKSNSHVIIEQVFDINLMQGQHENVCKANDR